MANLERLQRVRAINGWLWRLFLGLFFFLGLAGCTAVSQTQPLPTRVALASVPELSPSTTPIPPTFTPKPVTAVPTPTLPGPLPTFTPSSTPLPIPTNTPVTPTNTPTITPSPTPGLYISPTPVIKPLNQYSINEVIPFEAFPHPPNDNGWGMHWMPTVKQDPGVVDRFVAEAVRMHIKWVVFLNDGTNIGDNDYLVEKLVANGIMPVMRLYRSEVVPYDDNLGEMVAHYRAKGVYYFQIYNEPNVNIENRQGFANPNQYAVAWAFAARAVVANGGLPGIGALSPGGEYHALDFFDRTLRALAYNGDAYLLNHAWVAVHNYHGTRPYDDIGGFLQFRKYDEIVRSHLGRSLPIIGTEGGSYHPDPAVETEFIRYQYNYMRSPNREPYFFAFSWWLLANKEGGGHDETWEWQALFQPGFVHPAVTEFFYKNGG